MIPGHLDVLTAFVAVAEERSFTKAAVRLGVSTSAGTPSAASRRASASACSRG
jgi:DNA-binding transcriptional LysR family regulator